MWKTTDLSREISPRRPSPPTQEPNIGIWQLNFAVSAESSSSKPRKWTPLQIRCFSSTVSASILHPEAPLKRTGITNLNPKLLLRLRTHLTNTLPHTAPGMSVRTTQECAAWPPGLQGCLVSRNWNVKFQGFIQLQASLCSIWSFCLALQVTPVILSEPDDAEK